MVHDLVRFNLSGARLGKYENGVDRTRPDCPISTPGISVLAWTWILDLFLANFNISIEISVECRLLNYIPMSIAYHTGAHGMNYEL